MIVVAIIGLLAAIAIPNWVRARTSRRPMPASTTCDKSSGPRSSGLWTTGRARSATVTPEEILPYLKNAVVCPAGGSAATFGSSYSSLLSPTPPPAGSCQQSHVLPPDTHQLSAWVLDTRRGLRRILKPLLFVCRGVLRDRLRVRNRSGCAHTSHAAASRLLMPEKGCLAPGAKYTGARRGCP